MKNLNTILWIYKTQMNDACESINIINMDGLC